jgi:hypothetical protein
MASGDWRRRGAPGGSATHVRSWAALVRDVRFRLPPAPLEAEGRIVPTAVTAAITLEIGGTRWCNRIGRQHRANHVAWRVDLEAGTAHQTCWDAECRAARYRSRDVPVPPELMPEQCPPGAELLPPGASAAPSAQAALPSTAVGSAGGGGGVSGSVGGGSLFAEFDDEELLRVEL